MNNNTPSARQDVFRTVRELPDQFSLIAGILAVLVSSGLTIVEGHILRLMIDSALARNAGAFGTLVMTTVFVLLGHMLVTYVRRFCLGRYAEHGAADLRARVVERIGRAQLKCLEVGNSGDILSRLTNDLNKIREFTSGTLPRIVGDSLTAVLAFMYLMFINWQLTLTMTLVVPIILRLASIFSGPMPRLSRELQASLGVVNSMAQDALAAIKVTRAFGLEAVLCEKHQRAVQESVSKARGLAVRRAMLLWTSAFTSNFPFFVLFGVGGYLTVRGRISPGGIMAFVDLFSYLTMPVSRLPQLIGQAKADMAAAGRVFELLDLPVEREEGQFYTPVSGAAAIVTSDLGFAYDGRSQVLNGINLCVQQGEKVAIVGPSGSGKSTLLKLLLGFYSDYTGTIEILGHPITEWSLEHLRAQLGYVAQDTFLFPGTIRDNLIVGRIEANETEIRNAIERAGATEFVAGLMDGLDTRVGELGNRLSGGQRQRLSIVRALLKDAPILLLDEPTSNLDAHSEVVVQEAIKMLMANRTCLLVAHRLSTVRDADRIVVMDRGRVIDQGTHQELLERCELYRQLVNAQLSAKEAV